MAAIDHAAIAERAAPQLGLITTGDLERLGLSSRQVDRFLTSGVLRRIGRGVHALAGAPSSAHQRLLAATLLAGDGVVASHRAAAWVWGFDGVHPDGIELSVPRSRNPRTEMARIHRVRNLHLPPPRVQVVKALASTGRHVRLDAFYDDQRLVAEVNGHGSHTTRRQRQADAERRARLVAMGLRVVDFTYEDVQERPSHVTGTLATLLGLTPWPGSGNT